MAGCYGIQNAGIGDSLRRGSLDGWEKAVGQLYRDREGAGADGAGQGIEMGLEVTGAVRDRADHGAIAGGGPGVGVAASVEEHRAAVVALLDHLGDMRREGLYSLSDRDLGADEA